MFINKIMELYREACVHGLPVSLSLSHHNGRESFSFTSIPGPDVAGRPEPRRRPRGGRRRRGRENHGACAGQPTNAAPSYAAVTRSPPSPLVSHTAKRPRRLHAAAELDRPARPTMDANAAVDAANAAAANTADDNAGPDVFPTAGAPLHTAAAIDVVPTASAAAVSLAEEPPAANILHRDGIVNAAADVHPRRRRCNPPPLLMQLRGRNQSFRSSSPNIISSPTPSTPPSPLLQLDGCVTSPLNPNVNPLPPSATHKSTQTNPSPSSPPTLINTSTQTQTNPSPATVDVSSQTCYTCDRCKKPQSLDFYQRVDHRLIGGVDPVKLDLSQRTDSATIFEKFPHINLCLKCAYILHCDRSGPVPEYPKVFFQVYHRFIT